MLEWCVCHTATQPHSMYDTQPAEHAELAANGIVECASGRAPRSTTAAWDHKEMTTW